MTDFFLPKKTMKNYPFLKVLIKQQKLILYVNANQKYSYPISTAKNGIGQQQNSGCTPLGEHQICAKFGENLPINSVFVAREFTGEIYSKDLAERFPQRDWILSRILWLEGCEQGFNQGENAQGCCDSRSRFIYIHGTPDSEPMGMPLSHGCIRMKNTDILDLFDRVNIGTTVLILDC